MRIRSVALRNFRNLEPQQVELSSQLTFLVGQNGQGKTSLLEAIYFLAQARSFRAAKSREILRWGANGETMVSGVVETSSGTKELAVKIKGTKRTITLNGKVVTAANLFYGELIALEFTPDDLEIVKGSPAIRRRFIDQVLVMVDRSYVEQLVYYQRALKNRNKVLVEAATHREEQLSLNAKLNPWDAALVQYGRAITEKRATFLLELEPLFREAYRALLKNSDAANSERVKLHYIGQFIDAGDIAGEQQLLERYRQGVAQDMKFRSTRFGPHRDELEIAQEFHSTNAPARSAASQGQARSIVLALKLAATEYLFNKTGESPVLLLDDVESELDSNRKSALFEMISRLKSQVVVTATSDSSNLFLAADSPLFLSIKNGVISPPELPKKYR